MFTLFMLVGLDCKFSHPLRKRWSQIFQAEGPNLERKALHSQKSIKNFSSALLVIHPTLLDDFRKKKHAFSMQNFSVSVQRGFRILNLVQENVLP